MTTPDPTTLIAELKKALRGFHNPTFLELVAENAETIISLAEAGARLPRTADGKPITPGMVVHQVHTDDGPGRPCDPFIVRYRGQMKLRDDPYAPSIIFDAEPKTEIWRDCYSTPESAQRASDKTGK